MDELWQQTKGKYVPGQEVEPKKFPKQIAFNCIPQIDVFMEDGYTKEEWKMVAETKKILDPKIKADGDLRARAGVRRPFARRSTSSSRSRSRAEEAREILREAPGCLVIDKREPGGYITPIEAAGEDRDLHQPHPRGRDRRERPVPVDRVGQPAQGRGAQHRADRRDDHQPQAAGRRPNAA